MDIFIFDTWVALSSYFHPKILGSGRTLQLQCLLLAACWLCLVCWHSIRSIHC